ncbi:hypothetical protein PoB_007248000 [Plakobranchus ocellatus]|uniref:Uncharacterized protein n=1 Tax=Plakobranchus ocellatus TaxID=259542 RepID=A0AAV4DPI2_9GAST|nr:hypothetical protein PoB_007248000 [Plakobranchus ocellatus]
MLHSFILILKSLQGRVLNTAKKPSLQKGDRRLSSLTSGQGAGVGTRTSDKRVPADLKADSLATVPLTPIDFIKSLKIAIIGGAMAGHFNVKSVRTPLSEVRDQTHAERPDLAKP